MVLSLGPVRLRTRARFLRNTALSIALDRVDNSSQRTAALFAATSKMRTAYARIEEASFRQADLKGADFLYTDIKRARFDEAVIGPTTTIRGFTLV